jgi:hypothetical protein
VPAPGSQRLGACLRDRAAAPWVAGEEPYAAPPERVAGLGASERLASYRVPHHEHWRWDLVKARQDRRRLLF